jgi:hypothetical protein
MTTDDFADARLPVFAGVVARGGLVFKVGPAARVEAEEQPRRFGAPVALPTTSKSHRRRDVRSSFRVPAEGGAARAPSRRQTPRRACS